MMLLSVADCPSHFGPVRFSPPSVDLRKVEPAVNQHLHAAGPTRLPRPSWSVEPQVNALHQVLSNDHIVVRDKDDMRAHLRTFHELNPLSDHRLARFVRGMGLARNNQLHGELRTGEDAG